MAAKITVYAFKDVTGDSTQRRNDKRKASAAFIRSKGMRRIESTAEEVDASQIDLEGFYNPTSDKS
jgi:hypothetical protein